MHVLDHMSCDSRRKFLYIAVLIFIAILSLALCGCGGGSGGGGGGTYVDVNTLDGQAGIATDSNYQYTFTGFPDASTVTATSYFIVPTPAAAAAQIVKAAYDATVCDSTNAIGATVSVASHQANLVPTNALSGGSHYTVCLTTDITVGGSAFAGFMAGFTTAGGGTQTERLRITNDCSYTIWIQQQNMPASTPEIVKLVAGAHQDYAIPDAGQASTRFWPKTGCDSTGQNCTIGQSSDPCTNCPPPVDSKLESTWGCTLSSGCGTTPQGDPIGDTFWNMSAVDGYTLPFTTAITGNTITDTSAPCQPVDCSLLAFSGCPTDINLSEGEGGSTDPALANVNLQVNNSTPQQIGCYSPCKVLNYPTFGGYGLAETSTQGGDVLLSDSAYQLGRVPGGPRGEQRLRHRDPHHVQQQHLRLRLRRQLRPAALLCGNDGRGDVRTELPIKEMPY